MPDELSEAITVQEGVPRIEEASPSEGSLANQDTLPASDEGGDKKSSDTAFEFEGEHGVSRFMPQQYRSLWSEQLMNNLSLLSIGAFKDDSRRKEYHRLCHELVVQRETNQSDSKRILKLLEQMSATIEDDPVIWPDPDYRRARKSLRLQVEGAKSLQTLTQAAEVDSSVSKFISEVEGVSGQSLLRALYSQANEERNLNSYSTIKLLLRQQELTDECRDHEGEARRFERQISLAAHRSAKAVGASLLAKSVLSAAGLTNQAALYGIPAALALNHAVLGERSAISHTYRSSASLVKRMASAASNWWSRRAAEKTDICAEANVDESEERANAQSDPPNELNTER